MASFVKNVGIDHGRTDVLVAKQLMDGPDVITALKQMRSERMPKGVATDVLNNVGMAHSLPYDPLEDRFVDMVTPFLAGPCVFPAVLLGEYPLPTPVRGGVRVFTVKGVRHLDAPPSVGQVPVMDRLDFLEMVLKRGLKQLGKHGDPVLRARITSPRSPISRFSTWR